MTDAGGTLGCAVALRAGAGLRGRVCAVFRRSAHLQAEGVFISVGGPSLAAHPYTVAVPSFGGGQAVGQGFLLTSRELMVEGGPSISFAGMRVYTPSVEARPMAEPQAIIRALEATGDQMARLPSQGGFHEVLRRRMGAAGADNSSLLSRRLASQSLRRSRAVCEALRSGNRRLLASAAMALAGAGIGLTPAGDDFLAGVLAALRYHGRSRGVPAPEEFFEKLAHRAGRRTTPFSGFLLRCAARGLVSRPVSDWLEAVHTGRPEAAGDQVPALAAMGHSSGLDTLCGMLLALQAVMGERPWTQ